MTAVIQDPLDLPIVAPAYTPGMTLEQRYEAWREVNGHVVDALEDVVREWLAAGQRKVGVKFAGEVLRWRTGTRAHGDAWAINNSYLSRCARELIERHPSWASHIETRALASERNP